MERSIESLYPDNIQALARANLTPETIPALKYFIKENETKFATSVSVNSKHGLGGSTPIHIPLKKLRDKYNLKWLRINMSYRKFSNLGKIIQGDLNSKLIKGIMSLNFENFKCNYNSITNTDDKCIYDGKCMHLIVYKATCEVCNKLYKDNTQHKLKLIMNQYFNGVKHLVNKDLTSDSYSKHFATYFFQGWQYHGSKGERDK